MNLFSPTSLQSRPLIGHQILPNVSAMASTSTGFSDRGFARAWGSTTPFFPDPLQPILMLLRSFSDNFRFCRSPCTLSMTSPSIRKHTDANYLGDQVVYDHKP